MTTSLSEILDKKEYIKEHSLCFNFTCPSDIVIVNFLNFAPIFKGELKEITDKISSSLQVNYMTICGGNANYAYRFNLDGIIGFDSWTDPYLIGDFLYELLLVRNKFKYIIFTGDCGGAYTALLASKKVPVHSFLFTTPSITISDFREQGWIEEKVNAYKIKKYACDNMSFLQGNFDAFPIFLSHVNNGTKINIHWAINVVKTDLYEKNRVEAISNKRNLTITLHQIPHDMNPHHLRDWLNQTARMELYFIQEINIAKAYLSVINK